MSMPSWPGCRWSWKPSPVWGLSGTSLAGLLTIACSFAKLLTVGAEIFHVVCLPAADFFFFESSSRKVWLPKKKIR